MWSSRYSFIIKSKILDKCLKNKSNKTFWIVCFPRKNFAMIPHRFFADYIYYIYNMDMDTDLFNVYVIS